MELTHDWRSFQEMFYPHVRTKPKNPAAQSSSPVYVIRERERIVAVYAEHEDLSEWVGNACEEIDRHFEHRDVITFDRKQVDQWVTDSLGRPHFYDQIEHLRAAAIEQSVSRTGQKSGPRTHSKSLISVKRHFLLEALRGWWSKALPSSYGIFIRVEPQVGQLSSGQEILLIFRRGVLDHFIEPDLSSIGPDRRQQPTDVVKYLSEKYLVPVQGLITSSSDWQDWSESGEPWKRISVSIKQNRSKLVPFRWGVATLMATRGFLGL